MSPKKPAKPKPQQPEAEPSSGGLRSKLPDKNQVKAKYRRLERISITHIYKFVVMRWKNLVAVREHMLGWMAIVLLLLVSVVAQAVLTERAVMDQTGVSGGVYSEGVIGDIGNLNPIFAENDNEKALSRLMYHGLFTYDENGALQLNLLDRYVASEDGKSYEFTLANGIKWSDGQEIITDDVVFTVEAIKDATLASPYRKSFAKVTVEKIDEKKFTVRTSLPKYALFDLLIVGILPKHQLAEVGSLNMRNFYDQQLAVVSGPYQYSGTTAVSNVSSTMSFNVNGNYYRLKPLIPSIEIHTYADSSSLRQALANGDINAAVGLNKDDVIGLSRNQNLKLVQATLHDGVVALFNNTSLNLNQRQALRLAVDRQAILEATKVADVQPLALDGPTFGEFTVKQPMRNKAEAEQILENAGWKMDASGVRVNSEGKKLQVSFVVASGTNYAGVAEVLANNWQEIGVDVNLAYVDARQLQASYMIPRSYDVLLTQLKFGAYDDSSAYWHSFGATPVGTNYANYTSSVADIAINAAQVAKTDEERALRYVEFIKRWVEDAPAVTLYSPMFYYVADKSINTLSGDSIIDASWRFSAITEWAVLSGPVFKTP
jgi:peptide/nickel transport system substrate-binding protein